MRIGSIVDIAVPGYSQFATVRDEFGQNYTVPMAHLPDDSGPDDNMAYKVQFMNRQSGNITLHGIDP